jgi:hypothetical protein
MEWPVSIHAPARGATARHRPQLRIPLEAGHPFRQQSGHHSDVKAATRSEAKAAPCSDVKAATFRPSSEWVAGLPPE